MSNNQIHLLNTRILWDPAASDPAAPETPSFKLVTESRLSHSKSAWQYGGLQVAHTTGIMIQSHRPPRTQPARAGGRVLSARSFGSAAGLGAVGPSRCCQDAVGGALGNAS